MKNILEIKNLKKDYVNNKIKTNILDNISVDIYEGDFTVIMGQSGSGKSTFLYCVSGMDNCSGKIKYNDQYLNKLKEKKLINLRGKDFGFIFQQMHLVPNLTIFENVAIPGYNVNKNSFKVNEKAKELLNLVNIKNKDKYYPNQLSGGEQQRVAIARSLINDPKIVFADEPTGALNRKNANDVLNLFNEINDNNQSIIMVTHDLHSAIRGNRIIYIEDGKIKGELDLDKYTKDKAKEREQKVNDWLLNLMW